MRCGIVQYSQLLTTCRLRPVICRLIFISPTRGRQGNQTQQENIDRPIT